MGHLPDDRKPVCHLCSIQERVVSARVQIPPLFPPPKPIAGLFVPSGDQGKPGTFRRDTLSGLPLHPMVVHIPLALAIIAPFIMAIISWAVVRGKWRPSTWWMVVLLQGTIFVSALIATQLGERDEELVETVVAEQVIEIHEEWGQKMAWSSGFLLAAAILPLFFKKRALPFALVTILSLVSLFLALKTGHSGGELVYRHAAATVFSGNGASPPPALDSRSSRAREDDDGD